MKGRVPVGRLRPPEQTAPLGGERAQAAQRRIVRTRRIEYLRSCLSSMDDEERRDARDEIERLMRENLT